MSTLSVASLQALATATVPLVKDSAGTEYGQFCRAWVNWNGTGTIAIRDSFNVSSITDSGVGDYRINFTNAMPNANYALLLGFGGTSAVCTSRSVEEAVARTTSLVAVAVQNFSSVNVDSVHVEAAVFGH